MKMGGHEAERVDLEGEVLSDDVEDREEAEPVLVIGEDVPVIVAPQDHVINGPRYVDSALFGHAASIPRDIHLSTPGTMWPRKQVTTVPHRAAGVCQSSRYSRNRK